MHIIYGICIFIFSSSAIMVGYVLIRDIKHKRHQAAIAAEQSEEIAEEKVTSEEILAEYPHLVRKTA